MLGSQQHSTIAIAEFFMSREMEFLSQELKLQL